MHVDAAPTVTAILAYIAAAGAGATARIVPLTAAELAAAPQVPEITDFSSRGPSTTTGGDILKPDIAAPGIDVVAAVAPPTNFGRELGLLSPARRCRRRTSPASARSSRPLHPDVAAVGDQVGDHDDAPGTPSRARTTRSRRAPGSSTRTGRPIRASSTRRPPNEYRQYLVGLGVQFAPPFDTLTPITASNLNQASIAVGKLAGVETVTRRVKNVGAATATYTASVSVPGFDDDRDAVRR